MFGEIDKTHGFFTFGIAAFDVEIGVHSLQSFAEDGFYIFDGSSTAIGAFIVTLFAGPAGDASFAEQFTTGFTLERFQDNLDADGADEGLVSIANEAVWIVATCVHFCWSVI